MKHKHAEVIKAWADGLPIQYKHQLTGDWKDLTVTDPLWLTTHEFRVKPAKIVRWLWVYKNSTNIWRISTRYLTDDEAAMFYSERKKLDWSREEFES